MCFLTLYEKTTFYSGSYHRDLTLRGFVNSYCTVHNYLLRISYLYNIDDLYITIAIYIVYSDQQLEVFLGLGLGLLPD